MSDELANIFKGMWHAAEDEVRKLEAENAQLRADGNRWKLAYERALARALIAEAAAPRASDTYCWFTRAADGGGSCDECELVWKPDEPFDRCMSEVTRKHANCAGAAKSLAPESGDGT